MISPSRPLIVCRLPSLRVTVTAIAFVAVREYKPQNELLSIPLGLTTVRHPHPCSSELALSIDVETSCPCNPCRIRVCAFHTANLLLFGSHFSNRLAVCLMQCEHGTDAPAASVP